MKAQEQIKIKNAIRLIIEYLDEIGSIEYVNTLSSITVPAKSSRGFTVSFETNDNEMYLVSYGQWKRRFKNEGEAVFFFLKGLTPESRLKIERSVSAGITHTAEHHSDRTWHSEGAKTVLERRKALIEENSVRYLQNSHLQHVMS